MNKKKRPLYSEYIDSSDGTYLVKCFHDLRLTPEDAHELAAKWRKKGFVTRIKREYDSMYGDAVMVDVIGRTEQVPKSKRKGWVLKTWHGDP